MIKKVIVFFLIVIAIGMAIGLYLYNKPHKTASDVEIFEELSANDLMKQFDLDRGAFLKRYINKNLLISGQVQSFSQDSSGTHLSMSTQSVSGGIVSITFADSLQVKPITNQLMRIQGICIGFKEEVEMDGIILLGPEIQLNQAVVAQ